MAKSDLHSIGGTDVPPDIDVATTAGKLADLKRRVALVAGAGSERAVEKQHARGKKTARERLELLLDEGSFVEMDKYARHRSVAFGQDKNRPYGDGVVTGYGTVDGRTVAVFAQDFTVFGGSLGEVFGEKICKVMDFAMKVGCPVVGLNDSGGARIQEGVVSLGLYGEIFRRNVHASGVIPQISLIMGPCAGGAVYSPAVTDFTIMVDGTSHMFITGPDVIKTVTGEDVAMEDLGGARTHNTRSGNAHYLATDEEDAIDYVRALLSYLPSNNMDEPPAWPAEADLGVTDADRELDTLVPDSANQPYDMHRVIEHVLDDGEFAPLFSASSRAEVSVMGELALGGRKRSVSGKIGRLAVTDDAVVVLDYKTNRPAPTTLAEVPAAYVLQLALYGELLKPLYPGRRISAALLFTDAPRLIALRRKPISTL